MDTLQGKSLLGVAQIQVVLVGGLLVRIWVYPGFTGYRLEYIINAFYRRLFAFRFIHCHQPGD